MKVSCDFIIERETEKAVYAKVFSAYFQHESKYMWIPKSACEIETFVQTVNLCTNEPETYGKRIVAIEYWIMKKIRLFFK